MKPAAFVAFCLLLIPSAGVAQDGNAFRVLATSRTSTMQKEMQAAGAAGFKFASVMGGETAVGGKEVVVVMQKLGQAAAKFEYRLLATNRTSTMEKEMQEAADVGFSTWGRRCSKACSVEKKLSSSSSAIHPLTHRDISIGCSRRPKPQHWKESYGKPARARTKWLG